MPTRLSLQCGPRWRVLRSPWFSLMLLYLVLAVGLTVIADKNRRELHEPFLSADCDGRSLEEKKTSSDTCKSEYQYTIHVNVTLQSNSYKLKRLYIDETRETLLCLNRSDFKKLEEQYNMAEIEFSCWFHRRSPYALLEEGGFSDIVKQSAWNSFVACIIFSSGCLLFLLFPIWKVIRYNQVRERTVFSSILLHFPPPMYAIVATERLYRNNPSASSQRRRALGQRDAQLSISQFRSDFKDRRNELTDIKVCPICLEDFDESENNLVCFPCNHVYHDNCAEQWLRKGAPKCPYCMEDFSEIVTRIREDYYDQRGTDDERRSINTDSNGRRRGDNRQGTV